jgi:hypothetical protein
MNFEQQKDYFDDLVSKWDAALEKGIFKSPETPEVNPQTSQGSFFGMQNTHPTEEIGQSDQEYWNAIYSASSDHLPESNGLISEASEHKTTPSNPVARDSMGSDQEMNPQQLGVTYTEEELEKLSELKKELYSLESKLLTSMGFGDDKNQKKVQSQIESLKKEISKLSDVMGRAYKNEDQPKHLENV